MPRRRPRYFSNMSEPGYENVRAVRGRPTPDVDYRTVRSEPYVGRLLPGREKKISKEFL